MAAGAQGPWHGGILLSHVSKARHGPPTKNCVLYIEENPVRRGLAATAQEYPFSSASKGVMDAMPLHFQD